MSFDPDAHAAGLETSFDQMYPVFAALRQHDPNGIADFEKVLEISRRFRRDFVEPNALAVDREMMADPRHVAEDLLREAASRRYFSMMIPSMFGGLGLTYGALMVGLEELSAGCLGLTNLMAVHGLALSTVAATGDVAKMEKLGRLLTTSEKTGRPRLLSTAITEPTAGTDVEDVDLLRTAKLVSEAKPVRGGYRLNGRKVFISNGSIADVHVVIMPTDRDDAPGTMAAFLVETGTPGFSVGRVERKMGQKACPAAELVFDDCFVPEDARCGSGTVAGRAVDLVLGATRGGVAVFGAGVARGAYERAVRYARSHKLRGRWLLDQQWVQVKLADMLRNVMIARAAYVEAMLSNELFGLSSLLSGGALGKLGRWVPRAVLEGATVRRLVTSKRAVEATQRTLAAIEPWKIDTACAYGAESKVTATDLGIANCHAALDILGADGLRHDRGVEKLYRDAKLLQIYEGTNQLNRIEIFKRAVDRPRRPAGLEHRHVA